MAETKSIRAFQLREADLKILLSFFNEHTQLREVRIFGSRAKGLARDNSDIDLVAMDAMDFHELSRIATRLEELPLPYHIDFLAYPLIESEGLKNHIDDFSKPFYKRKSIGRRVQTKQSKEVK